MKLARMSLDDIGSCACVQSSKVQSLIDSAQQSHIIINLLLHSLRQAKQ